ncbi:MAG: polar amino acid transport system substrate-binding protein [bacterium]|jgi:polar amino acid transport system substrate-binding protein
MLARNNVEDGSATWRKNEKREALFYFSDVIYRSESVLFHFKKRPLKWNRLEDLIGINIGTTRKLSYGAKFDQMDREKILKIHRVTKDIQNYKKLLNGRIDVFLQQPGITYYQMKKTLPSSDYNQITHYPKSV